MMDNEILETLKTMSETLTKILNILEKGVPISTESINSYGEGIGEAIQGQIVRGNRGITQY